MINSNTISHFISPSRASEIEDDFSGLPEPGIHSGPVTPESNSGTGKVQIPAKSALFPVPLGYSLQLLDRKFGDPCRLSQLYT